MFLFVDNNWKSTKQNKASRKAESKITKKYVVYLKKQILGKRINSIYESFQNRVISTS